MRVAGGRKPVSSREFGRRGGASMDLEVCPVLVMSFDMLTATGSHSSLRSEVREMSPFGRGEPVSQVLRMLAFM